MKYTYYILTFCILVLLTCHYVPLPDPAAKIYGDAVYYRAMAQGGFEVPHPFHHRVIVPWLASLFPQMDVGFFVITFVSLLLTVWVLKWMTKNDLPGYFYLGTFWLTGYNLSNFWLQDAFVNLWLVVWVWCFAEFIRAIRGATFNRSALPLFVTGVALMMAWGIYRSIGNPMTWQVVSHAVPFYPTMTATYYTFGFLWLLFAAWLLQDKPRWAPWLLVLIPIFIMGRLVATDVHRVCGMVWFIPVLWGAALAHIRLDKVWMPYVWVGLPLAHFLLQTRWWY